MRRKENRITNRIALAIIASMVSMGIVAQSPTKRPTLVVGIMVDGLNNDYIELLKGHFGEGGFKRLINNGVTLENVEYGQGVDKSSATAMIFTGSPASVNGITSSLVYDTEKRCEYPILLDPSKIGNFTDETYSPSALLVSTLADEIRIDGGGTGYVYSIAPDATQAIIMAGHAGNSAFWINDITGRWATTTYYKDVPTPIQTRNYRIPLSKRLDTLSWTPSMPLEKYPDLPEYKRHYPFRHVFLQKDKDRYRAFKTSALVNNEVTSVASEYIRSLSLGNRNVMDMLNIAYSVAPYQYTKEIDNRVELMDSYIKLDSELSRLFQAIDRNIGLNNTLIFLAGTPASITGRRDDEKWNIPSGEFSPRKAISLLNMYLMAINGNGEWVKGFHDNKFYLNHKLIKERDLDIKKMRADAADFLSRMSGVTKVVTIDDINSGNAENSVEIRRNTNIKHCGDIYLTINPGWETIIEHKGVEKRITARSVATTAPVYILSPNINPQVISTEIDACLISPTVARLLRIRSPNASSMKPIRL